MPNDETPKERGPRPCPDSQDVDAPPARELLVELETRITTRSLHYRSGDEETAATSVSQLFATVRRLLVAHPTSKAFEWVALGLINDTARPYTARWHGWMVEERFQDARARRIFRSELKRLKAELEPYVEVLRAFADKEAAKANDLKVLQAVQGAGEKKARLGGAVAAGIGEEVRIAACVSAAQINQAERAAIQARRRVFERGKDASDTDQALLNATGLALSGGGIRAATFSLGVTQVLAERGLLPQIDYLSSVSGGGYFAAFLSSALHPAPKPQSKTEQKSEQKPVETPGELETAPTAETLAARIAAVFGSVGERESSLLRHLRNSSKYLLNGGTAARFKIVGLLLGGLALNLLLILPVPLVAVLIVFGADRWLGYWGDAFHGGNLLPAPTSPAGYALAGAATLFVILGALLPPIQGLLHRQSPDSFWGRLRRFWMGATLATGVFAALLGALFLLPVLFYRPPSIGGLPKGPGAPSALASLTAATGAISTVAGLLAALLRKHWRRLSAFSLRLFILTGPLFFAAVFLWLGRRMGLGGAPVEPTDPKFLAFLGATLALLAWGWLFVNINLFSLHWYYRDRLCECYLVRERAGCSTPETVERERAGCSTPEPVERLPLTDLLGGLAAPYRLINSTLNVPASQNVELRGRRGDFFLVSPAFCGSPLVGYTPTGDVEKLDPHFDLGTATAISGAAAATNMGWKTRPEFRFLLTVLNVRLGYWLPRGGARRKRLYFGGPGPLYLFREMFGRMTEDGRYLNLSDGGHIENLAVYELLRRRCKYIVCVDGGMEPGMECEDLIRLQRYAEIDLGVRLDFDLADLQLGPQGRSRAYAVLATIDYSPRSTDEIAAKGCKEGADEHGWMLFLKLALTGEEPAYVTDYRRENPAFPHETTGDHIYEEAQFEAYRRLGECAMNSLFREELVGTGNPASLESWFQKLADNLLPDNHPCYR